jgi:DHA1 family bicyclomycin/chloramphenicol resistance-like MFS transporter
MLIAGWRWIFGTMGILSSLVAWLAHRHLAETLHADYRQPIQPRAILINMIQVIRCREAVGYILGASAIQAALFGYIASSQQLVAEHFGAALLFPFVFGGMAVLMAGSNFFNSRIVERFGARRVSHTGTILYIAIAAIHLLFAVRGETLWIFMPFMAISMCLTSFVTANYQAIALQPFARIAGAAASVSAFVRVLIGSVAGTLIGQAYDGTPRPLLATMVTVGVLALSLVLYSERGRLFRRLNPPSRPPL